MTLASKLNSFDFTTKLCPQEPRRSRQKGISCRTAGLGAESQLGLGKAHIRGAERNREQGQAFWGEEGITTRKLSQCSPVASHCKVTPSSKPC